LVWESVRGPERARLAELDRVAELRGRLLARAAEASEPAYLTALVGPRPSEPQARRTWLAAASAVEAYRDRWAVDDAERALGAEPGRQAPRRQRVQRDAAGEIVRAAAEALGRAQDRGRDRSRVAEVAVGPPALAR
jgi:hypothetical protein